MEQKSLERFNKRYVHRKLMNTCIHLQQIERTALDDDISVSATGDWWQSGTSDNLYLNCILNKQKINEQFELPSFVEWYEYDGRVAGHEEGLYCKKCNSLLVGGHHVYGGMVLWPK